jgi:hypothetical protein
LMMAVGEMQRPGTAEDGGRAIKFVSGAYNDNDYNTAPPGASPASARV